MHRRHERVGRGELHAHVHRAAGTEPLLASFAGDAFYKPSADTSKTAIVFAFPSRGAFVLGDGTVAGAGAGAGEPEPEPEPSR